MELDTSCQISELRQIVNIEMYKRKKNFNMKLNLCFL